MARNSNLTHGMLIENQNGGLIAINQSYTSQTQVKIHLLNSEGLNYFQSLMILASHIAPHTVIMSKP